MNVISIYGKSLCIILSTFLSLIFVPTRAQWLETGNPSTNEVPNFIGTTNNQGLSFRTNSTLRMRLMKSQNYTINGITGQNTAGFLGLSTNTAFWTNVANPQSAFSLLHLNTDAIPQQIGYRSWMNPGITFTHNGDLMYVGPLKNNATDLTDAAIVWSDNSSPDIGPDNLRFIFSTGNGLGAAQTSDGPQGLETARITPWGYMGIGKRWSNTMQPQRRLDVDEDVPPTSAQFRVTYTPAVTFADFQTTSQGYLCIRPTAARVGINLNGTNIPTEALDVNLGTARLRNMPNETPNVLVTGVVESGAGDYVLNYLEFSNDPDDVLAGDGSWVNLNDASCEWNEVTNGLSQDLVMGYTTPTTACNTGRVGIGLIDPEARLHVINSLDELGETVLVEAVATNDPSVGQYGILTRTQGGGDYQVAIAGYATATASLDPPTHPLIGTMGSADPDGFCAHNAVGIYGEILNPEQTCGSSVAGYFNSSIVVGGATINISDESVKTDVNSISGALDGILHLQPKSYYLSNELLPGAAFDDDLAFGLIAQEAQEVFPNIVKEVAKPLIRDDEGNLTSQEGELLGVAYEQLIPILIAAMQEQQAQIEELSAQVSACCAVAPDQRSGAIPSNDILIEQSANRLDQNIPNPFDSNTRIGFNLANDCHVRICIYNSTGQQIDCLIDQFKTLGAHNIEWNTSNLASGIYYYSLETDGFEQVRRAVKL